MKSAVHIKRAHELLANSEQAGVGDAAATWAIQARTHVELAALEREIEAHPVLRPVNPGPREVTS